MNPDIWTAEYQGRLAKERQELQRLGYRQLALHKKAVKRRKKRKNGGPK